MVKIALCGDIFITRPFPSKEYEGMSELVELLNSHEVKFGNLETTVHRREGYPAAFPGGTWGMTDPDCLDDIKRLGINALSTANNHAMDYSHNGLLATHKYLREKRIPYAGTGENLADAAGPVYIECAEARVALIGATSSFHDADAAGSQSGSMRGRPGVNPLRHKSVYEVTEENLSSLKRIAEELGINDYHDQARKEGYLLPKENFNFADSEFIAGEHNILHTYPCDNDLERIVKSIEGAKRQSDYVVVSIHSHQFSGGDKKNPAEFIRIFARSCIDAGASIVVGHGPHTIRGVEAYKKGVILYGLGNFIFQNETVPHLPADYYEKYSIRPEDGVGTAIDKRNKSGTVGLVNDRNAWKGILASVEIDDKKICVGLYPLELGYDLPTYRRGLPKIARFADSLAQTRDLSSVFGTEVNITDGVGSIIIDKESE